MARVTWGGFADRVGPRSRTPGGRGGAQAAHSLRQVPADDGAGADSCLRMPGEEEERAFQAAREELTNALRKDSGQVFSMEQLQPLLVTSLPPAARYLQLNASRLVRCNALGEVRPGPAREGDWRTGDQGGAHSSPLSDCSQPRNYLNTLSTALNILEKYGRNLLSPQRPRYWRGVKFNNPVFRSTVDAVQVKPPWAPCGRRGLSLGWGVG